MSSRTNPFEELERMMDRLNRQFEDAGWWWGEGPTRETAGGEEFAVDVLEEPDAIVVTVDVPGFDRDEIDVRVADRTLQIEAKQGEEVEEGDELYLRRERRQRTQRRSIRLPTEVDADGTEAKLKNGVLTVTIPKAEPAEEIRQVEIESE